ncbi:MAG: hypothetical protein F4X80_04760 [Chloroflexi bacterium]|nr:hypothetical protein [Chloroflexota bacterium]
MSSLESDPIPSTWRSIPEALGDYFLYFAQIEEAMTVLFAVCQSIDPENVVEFRAWLEAESRIDPERLSAGRLHRELQGLVPSALGGDSEPGSNARDAWDELSPRIERAIDDRNSLIHRELPRVEYLTATTQPGISLHDGGVLTYSGLTERAGFFQDITYELRTFLWTFIRADRSPTGET